jgi:hypothetical protein
LRHKEAACTAIFSAFDERVAIYLCAWAALVRMRIFAPAVYRRDVGAATVVDGGSPGGAAARAACLDGTYKRAPWRERRYLLYPTNA